MNVAEFERAVFELEEVRIIIRASSREIVDDFNYSRKTPAGTSITDWLDLRVHPLIRGYGVVVVDGEGGIPHGRKKMSTLRESYER